MDSTATPPISPSPYTDHPRGATSRRGYRAYSVLNHSMSLCFYDESWELHQVTVSMSTAAELFESLRDDETLQDFIEDQK